MFSVLSLQLAKKAVDQISIKQLENGIIESCHETIERAEHLLE